MTISERTRDENEQGQKGRKTKGLKTQEKAEINGDKENQ